MENKPYMLLVSLDPQTARGLVALARATDRSRTAMIRHLIRQEILRRKGGTVPEVEAAGEAGDDGK